MVFLLFILFVVGYTFIVLEHKIHLDKAVPALLMGGIMWGIVALAHIPVGIEHGAGNLEAVMLHHTGKIAEIILFIMGAMALVELIDLHEGFSVITSRIHTQRKARMLWIIAVISFFLSAVIDSLTTAIVVTTMLRKLVGDRKERLVYVSIVVLAANAGGAWSPIGAVTTTMFWIANKVSTFAVVGRLLLPSLVCMALPVWVLSRTKGMRGNLAIATEPTEADVTIQTAGDLMQPSMEVPNTANDTDQETTPLPAVATDTVYTVGRAATIIFFVGLGAFLFVPIFKVTTHLPPYLGMMISLATVWAVSEWLHPAETFAQNRFHAVLEALSRISVSGLLFFLGILLAVASLEAVGGLNDLAAWLDSLLPRTVVAVVLGILSAIVDNVPLTAAAIGMYNVPTDDPLWHLLAFTTATGGSLLIIGSAAGVAAMGMEKIEFGWYLRRITWLALLGYTAGVITYLIQSALW